MFMSNFGEKAADMFVRKFSVWNASGFVHSSRVCVPDDTSELRANNGMKIGPSSFDMSPLTKKRTRSLPPLAFMPYASRCPRCSDVVAGFVITLNDVKLSRVHSFWLSDTSVQRVVLPVESC